MESQADRPKTPDQLEADERRARRPRNQARYPLRSYLPVTHPDDWSLSERAMRWCFPWSRHDYPGLRRGFLALLPRHYTWGAIKHWRFARCRFPVASAVAVEAHIRARCAAGLGIADALAAYIREEEARPPRGLGLVVVGDDGRSKRGSWRR